MQVLSQRQALELDSRGPGDHWGLVKEQNDLLKITQS